MLRDGAQKQRLPGLRNQAGFHPRSHVHPSMNTDGDLHRNTKPPFLLEGRKFSKAEHVMPRWRNAHFPLPEPAVPGAEGSAERYRNLSKKS